MKKFLSGILVTLILTSLAILAFKIPSVKSSGTIYIRADGSVEPQIANITSVDNVTYTFTGNNYDEIVVERDNIVVDGAGYIIQGLGSGNGIDLSNRSNITVRNTIVKEFSHGIHLDNSSTNTISGNNIENNTQGIFLLLGDNNTVSENNITNNQFTGILMQVSSNNVFFGNHIANNGGDGIVIGSPSNTNTISGNNITANTKYGIELSSQNCIISENNIEKNEKGIYMSDSSSGNRIVANTMRNSIWDAITFSGASNNIMIGNNITDNKGAIQFTHPGTSGPYPVNNTIYHNNFINNTYQIIRHGNPITKWDDGYPSGGNYWSSYTGIDVNQDGLGDSPYILDAENQDNYPLMHPWSSLPVHNINTGVGYETIQEAIDVSETLNGHTIFVEEGTYYENIVVNKTLSLIGENKLSTIIDGNSSGTVMNITADSASISGFTIQGSGGYPNSGIYMSSSSNNICFNVLTKNLYFGILLWNSSNNTIIGNCITNNTKVGVYLGVSIDNTIAGNNITENNSNGIWFFESSNNNISGNNISENKHHGIALGGSSNNTISENNITNNVFFGIALEVSSNNIISENNIKNSSNGVRLYASSNNTILGNTVSSNDYGTFLDSSTNNSISDNTVYSNSNDGIALHSSNNNTISANYVTSNGLNGVYLFSGGNNNVSKNNIANNSYCGFRIENSPKNSLKNNSMAGNYNNFWVTGFDLSDYTQDIDTSNTVNEKLIYYFIAQNNLTIDLFTCPEIGYLALINSTNVTVERLEVKNNGQGLLLAYTTNSRITNNNITNNIIGIHLARSSRNSLSGNVIANNGNGVWLHWSVNNTISANYIMNNVRGVSLQHSWNNSIFRNNIRESHDWGIDLWRNCSYSIISSNDIVNNSVGIYLTESTYNIIFENNVENNSLYGIQLQVSSYNRLSRNSITDNIARGIDLYGGSGYNTISQNTVARSHHGIYLDVYSGAPYNNMIYQNNFIDNIDNAYVSFYAIYENTWDDGSPSGGNYWSDYNGIDSNNDGIGDSWYEIDGNNIDHYPLKGMFSDFNATSEYYVQTICNSSITNFRYNGTAINFNVTGGNGTEGFCRICIPTSLMNDPFRVFVNGVEIMPSPEPLPCSNSTHTYLYFIYSHSTQEVIIIPEFPSFVILPLFMIAALLANIVYKKKAT